MSQPATGRNLIGDALSIRRNRRRRKTGWGNADGATRSIGCVDNRERAPIAAAVPHHYRHVAVVRKPAWRGQHRPPGIERSRRAGRIRHDPDGSNAVDSQLRAVGGETQAAIGGSAPELFRLTTVERRDPQLAATVECQRLAIGMKSGGGDVVIYLLRRAAGRRDERGCRRSRNNNSGGHRATRTRRSAILICPGEVAPHPRCRPRIVKTCGRGPWTRV